MPTKDAGVPTMAQELGLLRSAQSPDFAIWSLASPINQIPEDDGFMQRIKAQVPIGSADRLFLRLRVSR